MPFLLDTNVWIELLKKRNIALVRRFANTPNEQMHSCSVVRAEMMHGTCKYDDPAGRRHAVLGIMKPFKSFSFDDACADAYARIRHDLEQRRCIIGPYDLQIAAIALVHGLTVVTGNDDEFRRVQGLQVEDWSVPLDG